MNQDEEIELVVGTYEDYVVGYRLELIHLKDNSKSVENGSKPDGLDSNRLSLDQSFAVRSHSGSVRSIACNQNGSLLFTAGHDETTNLFNLKRRRQIHTTEGAINCSLFVDNSHLICGSEDGNIYIHTCRGSTMTLSKILKGHHAAVTSLSAHPTGKILLSLSKDKTMRTWNLMKGRPAYVTNINSDSHLVKWSKRGEEFVIAADREIYLFSIDGTLIQKTDLPKRVNSVEFIDATKFVVAGESGDLFFFEISTKSDNKDSPLKLSLQHLLKLNAHKTRVKSVQCFHLPKSIRPFHANEPCKPKDNGETKKNQHQDLSSLCLATVSSDGVIKVWSLFDSSQEIPTLKPSELVKIDVGSRVTCMVGAVR